MERAMTGPLDMPSPARSAAAPRPARIARRAAALAASEQAKACQQQHRLAAVAVGHRSPGELADGEAEQVGGEVQLRGARLGAERRAITGTEGRNMSMPSAVSATRTPRSSVKGSEA
jgi:hypothetical protein